jgi:hypothetical protein
MSAFPGAIEAKSASVADLEARVEAQEARIRELEAMVRALARQEQPAPAPAVPPAATAVAAPAPSASPAAGASAPLPAPSQGGIAVAGMPLDVWGDFRLRYESNFSDAAGPGRDREVVRVRLRSLLSISDSLSLGAQMVLGDPDDPNSTDVTLSGFDDDLPLSLDMAYFRYVHADLEVFGGKFPLPFLRTDLVWDGDVNPQGVSAVYTLPLWSRASMRMSGIYFIIDENPAGADSRMRGGQIAVNTPLGDGWRIEAAAAYYDYALNAVLNADLGDTRSNRLRPDGSYLSDFNLLDTIVAVTYEGLSPRWPIRLTADHVWNYGAAFSTEEGFNIELQAGRAVQRGDLRFGYAYAETSTDAVLTAFSHDNTALASNYIQHSMMVDYVLDRNIMFNATLYHYRARDDAEARFSLPGDWLNRLRLNVVVGF